MASGRGGTTPARLGRLPSCREDKKRSGRKRPPEGILLVYAAASCHRASAAFVGAVIEIQARGGGSQGLILSPVRRVPRPLPGRSFGPQARIFGVERRACPAEQPVPGCGSPASCRFQRRHRAAACSPRVSSYRLSLCPLPKKWSAMPGATRRLLLVLRSFGEDGLPFPGWCTADSRHRSLV